VGDKPNPVSLFHPKLLEEMGHAATAFIQLFEGDLSVLVHQGHAIRVPGGSSLRKIADVHAAHDALLHGIKFTHSSPSFLMQPATLERKQLVIFYHICWHRLATLSINNKVCCASLRTALSRLLSIVVP
jgi:hypothetical protein